jgi:hypothetical protein
MISTITATVRRNTRTRRASRTLMLGSLFLAVPRLRLFVRGLGW